MILVTANPARQLVQVRMFGRVEPAQVAQGRAELTTLLAGVADGFQLLVDLSELESMDIACAAEMGRIMELCSQHRVSLVVRIMPDPAKDIGMNILSAFHYHHRPRIITCRTLLEAGQALKLDQTDLGPGRSAATEASGQT
ncbi:MAG TPA: hypothetical protein VL200_16400 [Lacunisphaera sp.]|jgi:hypothetical protein|nr:hypothetical protein [Lacunisphaera sp.]